MAKFKTIIKKKTENLLIQVFISLLIRQVKKKEKKNKKFSFVLAGGKSPVKLYKFLSKAKINWNSIDLFWGDERYVSNKSINSNFKMVYENLIKKIKIDKKNLFSVNTKKNSPKNSALDYQKRIKKYFRNKRISFDLILLGLGHDGHVASIFPNHLHFNKEKIVYDVDRKNFKRITLSMNTINNSKQIILWLNNKKKKDIFKKLKNKKEIPVNYLNTKKTKVFIRK